MDRILVTGGAGFIGSNFVHHVIAHTDAHVTVLDKLTYAATRESLGGLPEDRVDLVVGDIADAELVDDLVGSHRRGRALRRRVAQRQLPRRPAPVPAAPTSSAPSRCWRRPAARRPLPPHLHRRGVRRPRARRPEAVHRGHAVQPVIPYSSTKAGSRPAGARLGALASACGRRSRTAPTTTGPYQHVEKFIPRQITNVIGGIRPKLYGDGENVRDWIHADDHSSAVLTILEKGRIGETYLIGADGEKNNREVVELILTLMGQRATTRTTTSPTAPATTCATPSTRRSCAPSSAGSRRTATSRRPRRDDRRGTATTRTGGRPPRTPPRRSTPPRASDGRLGKRYDRDRPRSPGWSCRTARPRRRPRLVQGELAAREDGGRSGCPTSVRCRTTSRSTRRAGTTRGIHAEPWDKCVSVATGRIFGAWVDLREGDSFGAVFTAELDPSRAIFVPRGVGNAYQTLETRPATPTSSTTTGRPRPTYTFLNLADETAAIAWPIPLDRRRDLREGPPPDPRLADVDPDRAAQTLVARRQRPARAGAAPQFCRGPTSSRPRADLDLTDPRRSGAWPWRDYDTIINAAAYTAVDAAETERAPRAWAANVDRARGARRASPREHGITLVHVSSDYVFDGTASAPTARTSRSRPSASTARPRPPATSRSRGAAPLHRAHLVGDRRRQQLRPHDGVARRAGHLAQRRRRPGRTPDLHRRAGPRHPCTCSTSGAPFGTYNLSNGGPVTSWADIAREVFRLARPRPGGRDRGQHRRLLRRQGGRSPAAAQRARPGEARGDRVHAHRRLGQPVLVRRRLTVSGGSGRRRQDARRPGTRSRRSSRSGAAG